MNDSDSSPLMRQYRDIKQGYPGAILFFRVGDFYEMFYEDAREASRLLSIALTSRDKNSQKPVPLCGVPYHAANGYIAKLLKAGRTVALCEQVEDPKMAKGLVRREVVRLYTPGTLVETEFLSPAESNFLVAVAVRATAGRDSTIGCAALEVTTGEFWITECGGPHAVAQILDGLAILEPREVLYPEGIDREFVSNLEKVYSGRRCARPAASFNERQAIRTLQDQFQVRTLDTFGCQGLTVALGAAGAVLEYFRETQPNVPLGHLRRLFVRWHTDSMHLDSATIRNLELVKPLAAGESTQDMRSATLLSVLDRTATAMGSRLLRQWLVRPLVDCRAINARLDAVGELKDRTHQRVALRAALLGVQDIARLSSRIVLRLATPRELLSLKESLSSLPEIALHLSSLQSGLLAGARTGWDDGRDLYDLIERSLQPDAPVSVRDGNIIREGYDPAVDEWRKASKEGKNWIAALESKEREQTGIESLKIRFNQVYGYYIEITKSNLTRVPSHYTRKQTLVNGERFMTPELKELEERVTGAELKLLAAEQEVFANILEHVASEAHRLEKIAETVSHIDVLAALAETAALNRYTRPVVDEGGFLTIKDGRHPVVERLGTDMAFVPNDTVLDLESNRMLILTGPNMAGKSTYLRQVALIVLLAQTGSFVPASEAHIGLVDRVFTRVGASDSLATGQSTFMVEMVEMASILNSATQRSLILLDEVGRGTSTYDGLSIAWAIAEHIHDRTHLGARTLFATHYHEMTQLERQHQGVKNYRVAVKEQDGDVVFLRKIVPGGADKSYGIHVARLAGLPQTVLMRAHEVLAQLERPESLSPQMREAPTPSISEHLPQSHPIIEEVRQIDLFSLTPLDALNRLAQLQRMAEVKGSEVSNK